MRHPISATLLATLVAAAGLTVPVARDVSASTRAKGYHPRIDPAQFSTTIDNPWFPLVPGTTRVYEGTTDGKPTRTVVTVTGRTKRLAGVDTVVVRDQGFVEGRLEETTLDYFAQDAEGTVWYFGEDTRTVDRNGRTRSAEGTWHAGRGGAQPGIVMEAEPTIGRKLRQEFLKGHALDWYEVVDLSTPITVPYGSFDGLQTSEWTPLEPKVLDAKVYARGVGQISESSVKGGAEYSSLVTVARG